MKWISHKLTTFAICYTLTGSPIQGLIASASSTLPDAIEFGPGILIFRKHRGTSHNPLFWLLTLPVLFFFLKKMIPEVTTVLPGGYFPEPETFFWAITAGVFLHLAADSFSGSGIPLWGKKKIALKLYRTFSHSEFIVVFFVISTCGICFALRRFLFS